MVWEEGLLARREVDLLLPQEQDAEGLIGTVRSFTLPEGFLER